MEPRSKRCVTCSSNLDSVQRECCISSCWWLPDRTNILTRNCNCAQRSKFCIHTPAANSLPWSLRFEEVEDPSSSIGTVRAKHYIPVRTIFGPLVAPVQVQKTTSIAKYYVGSEDSGWSYYDLESEELCNWMKFVHQAEHTNEQNLTAFQFNGAVYFAALEGIIPGEELKVYYANNYAAELGKPFISLDQKISLTDLSISDVDNFTEEPHVSGTQIIQENPNSINTEDTSDKSYTASGLEKILVLCLNEDFTKKTTVKLEDALPFFEALEFPVVQDEMEIEQSSAYQECDLHSTLIGDCIAVKEFSTEPEPKSSALASELIGSESDGREPTESVADYTEINTSEPESERKSERKKKSYGPHNCVFCLKVLPRAQLSKHYRTTHCESGIYSCPSCPKTSHRLRVMTVHVRYQHMMSGNTVCSVCSFTAKTPATLRSHMLTHASSSEIWECGLCEKSFPGERNLRRHLLRIHDPEREDKNSPLCRCVICSEQFPNSVAFSLHLRSAHFVNETYSCPGCEKPFLKYTTCRDHYRKEHDKQFAVVSFNPKKRHVDRTSSKSDNESDHSEEIPIPKNWELLPQKKSTKSGKRQLRRECVFCLKSFPRKQLSGHYKSHCVDGLYKCRICSKTVDSSRKIYDHIRRSHKPTRYNCTSCPFTSKLKRVLDRHVLANHPEGGRFKCEQCGKYFEEHDYLQKHLLIHSNANAGKATGSSVPTIPKCDVCQKTFKKRFELLRHSAVHAKDLPWECGLCGGRFKGQRSLEKHIRYFHDPKREEKRKNTSNGGIFKCLICSAEFPGCLHLQQHVPIHLEDEMYSCPVCQQTYRTYKKLRSHYRSHLPSSKIRSRGTTKRTKKKLKDVKFEDYFYKCRECRLGFTTSEFLVAHLDSIHPDLSKLNVPELNFPRREVGAFRCLLCKRLTFTEEDAEQHFRLKHPQMEETRDEIECFEKIPCQDALWCEICNSAFVDPKVFVTHVKKVHPGYFSVLMTPLNVV